MIDILNIILKDTYTVSQLKRRVRMLQYYFQQKFFQSAINEAISPEDAAWFKTLPASFLNLFNKDNLSQIIAQLSSQINKMPVITVFLPFEASEGTLDQIGIKARSLFNPALVLDIKYNPSLTAGCAISWKGIYKDFSLHSRIEERKPAILESFKKFLR